METKVTPAPNEEAIVGIKAGDLVKRHRLTTRLWHWINALSLLVLLMSGLMIFNAHPRLYWGQYGANSDPAWLQIGSQGERGYLRVTGRQYDMTGILGVWKDSDGAITKRAFPYWITIPSNYDLAVGRRWHLAFAWVFAFSLLVFLLYSLFNRHIYRDLHIRRGEWSPKHIWNDIKQHALLRFPTGKESLKYSILQKLSYTAVIFIALPLMIFTGLSMSPGMNTAWPWLLDIFGGRQSARSIHFICCFFLVGFFLVHIAMVLLAGPINEVRSMITGKFRIPPDREQPEAKGA